VDSRLVDSLLRAHEAIIPTKLVKTVAV
jgi:hypothetical protein